jgi:broad specificity phosphatase PhoE
MKPFFIIRSGTEEQYTHGRELRMAAHHVFFIRHFAKESHPFRHVPSQDIGWYVRRWNDFDRTKLALSSEGRRQGEVLVERLGRELSAYGADVRQVFVSPYQRTCQTAELLRPAFPQARFVLDERLREVDAGIECIWPYEELAVRYPEYRAAVEAQNYLCVPRPFGESHLERRESDVRSFFDSLYTLDTDVCAITHAGIIDLAHQIARGLSDEQVLERFQNPNRVALGSVLHCWYDPIIKDYVTDQDPVDLLGPSA